jgi:hypothetical protein
MDVDVASMFILPGTDMFFRVPRSISGVYGTVCL